MFVERVNRVLDVIENDLSKWNQQIYINTCGTTACFAGHAYMLSQGYFFTDFIEDDFDEAEYDEAVNFLGLSEEEAYSIFHWGVHLEEFDQESFDMFVLFIEAVTGQSLGRN